MVTKNKARGFPISQDSEKIIWVQIELLMQFKLIKNNENESSGLIFRYLTFYKGHENYEKIYSRNLRYNIYVLITAQKVYQRMVLIWSLLLAWTSQSKRS